MTGSQDYTPTSTTIEHKITTTGVVSLPTFNFILLSLSLRAQYCFPKPENPNNNIQFRSLLFLH